MWFVELHRVNKKVNSTFEPVEVGSTAGND